MNSKGLAMLAMVFTLVAVTATLGAQASDPPNTGQPKSSLPHSSQPNSSLPSSNPPGSTTYAYPVPAPTKPDCNGTPCDDQQPRVIVTLPAPAPTPWPIHDRIAWAAYLVLAILGYAGIMLALSALKKIERHTSAAEVSAAAAAEAAQAALLHAQAIVNAERPWLTIGVEPTPGIENSFNVIATNRGRSPGTITSALDQIVFAADETHLPAAPSWKPAESSTPFLPIILLPGEFVSIRAVKRDDAKALSGSDEKFKSIEAWEERLFLCGKVTYNDLMAPAGKEAHETNWCCWYIHGRQKSGLAIAGPPAYHTHT